MATAFSQAASQARSVMGATLAQSVEQLIRNQQVVGSNPTGGSRKANKLNGFSGMCDLAIGSFCSVSTPCPQIEESCPRITLRRSVNHGIRFSETGELSPRVLRDVSR